MPWTLTPTSSTAKSIGVCTTLESTRSTAGSSSTNSPTHKCDIVRVTSADRVVSETTKELDDENKSNSSRLPKDENCKPERDAEDIFLASDDDFFRIRNSISESVIDDELSTLTTYQLKELTSADSLEVMDDRLALLSKGRLNDLEAVKATLQIHFDDSSSPRASCGNEDDVSSEDKHDDGGDRRTLMGEDRTVKGEGQTAEGEGQTAKGEGQILNSEDQTLRGHGQTLKGENEVLTDHSQTVQDSVQGSSEMFTEEIQGECRTLSEVQGEGQTLSDIQGEVQTLSDVQGEGQTLSDIQGEGQTLSDEGHCEGQTLSKDLCEFECDFSSSESSHKPAGDRNTSVRDQEGTDKTSDINGCVSSTFKTSAFRGHHRHRDLSPDTSSQSSISDDYTMTAEVVS